MADEYFSPGQQQQNLYPQQDFSRLPAYQQQQAQQQRWAQQQQQLRANQYAAAMKQKQMAAMRYPQQQQSQQQQYNSPAFSQQGFNFPGTPQQQMNQPGTPRDANFNNQRDFNQREFSGTPSREFSSTPAPAPVPTPTPNQNLSQPHPNRMGMNMMQQPHSSSRTGTPIVRPGTAMSGNGGFNERASQPPQTPKMGVGMSMTGMSIPNVPNMGMTGNAMAMQNNMGMNNMGANNMGGMGMGGANGMGSNMAMGGNSMNGMASMGVNNLGGMGANHLGGVNANNLGGMANNMGGMMNMGGNMGASNMGMGANNLGMAANSMGMANNSLGMNMGNLNMNANMGAANLSGSAAPNLGMPGGAMASANNLGMPGTAPALGIAGTTNNMGMPGGGMPGAANSLGMPGAGSSMGMNAANGLSIAGAGMAGPTNNMAANNLGMPGSNNPGMPGVGNMSPTKPIGLGINVGGGAPNGLAMGATPNALGMAAAQNTLGMGGTSNALGMNPAANVLTMGTTPNTLGMAPAPNAIGMGAAPNALGMPTTTNTLGIGAAPNTNALGMGGMGPMVNGMAGMMNGMRANPPNKLSRRVVSNPSASPTKTSAVPSLPLPPGVNPQTTLVTPLPLLKDENDLTHGGALPPVSEAEMKEIKYWMSRDEAFQQVYTRDCEHRKEEETALRAKHAWWEADDHPMPSKSQIWWPAEVRKLKERKMKLLGRNFRCLDVSQILRSAQAITQPEVLVPIRIEVDHDHYRLRDTFTWNLNDPVISPDDFAQCLCDDFGIDSKTVMSAVAKSIAEQLTEHRAHIVEPASGPKREVLHGGISDKDAEWWARWRAKVAGEDVSVEDEPEFDEVVDKEKDLNEELRVLIKLDVIVGTMNLTDQLEWDMNDPSNSPEQFAEIYCQDLGLGGEFKTAVAHSIREQISVYQKSLFLVGHPFDGTAIADDELRTAMLPPIDHSFRFDRALLEQFTPQLNVLQDGEIERNERERERELKRKRRQTRGRRGVALPDRDLQKTHRTAIGHAEVEPSPAQQAAQQQAPVTFRRAAAAAASLTIANLAATENGTPVPTNMHMMESQRLTPVIPQQQQQQQPPPPPPKQKPKRNGVLQPPPLPKSVFLARAGASAPTPASGLEPEEASAARAEFGDNEPERAGSPNGGDGGDEDGQAAMLRRVLEKEGTESTEGLHANMIGGTWHCANCGCPESISIGRRKGPLGQGTMCGECGKYWHKHRKPRPVEYNTSIEHHLNLKKQAKAKKRGNKGNANANPSPSKPSSTRDEAPVAEAEAEVLANGRDSLSPSPPPQKPTALPFLDPGSPDSTIGPDSPKAEPSTLPTAPVEPTLVGAADKAPSANETGTPPAPSTPAQTPQPTTHTRDGFPLPQWITDCLASTQRRYPNDRIEMMSKARPDGSLPPEFRLKCLDCPGKLYTPGPDQSLTNFEVHLKNRVHRANVNRRVGAETGSAPVSVRRATPSAATPNSTPAPAPAPASTPTPAPAPSS